MSFWRAGASLVMTWIGVITAMLQSHCSAAACTDSQVIGLRIQVRDASTGAALCDSAVVAFDGSYQEYLSNFGAPVAPCVYSGAAERAGTYRVLVSRAGYVSTEITGLVVSKEDGDCHIEPAIMRTIDLVPDASALREVDAGQTPSNCVSSSARLRKATSRTLLNWGSGELVSTRPSSSRQRRRA